VGGVRVAYLTLFSLRSNYNRLQQTSHYNLLASKAVTSNVDSSLCSVLLLKKKYTISSV